MKVQNQAIQLSTTSQSSIVKTSALFTFRALRTLAGYVAELPAVATQVANDVQAAWEESAASPKQ
jgi:hypothetical protein